MNFRKARRSQFWFVFACLFVCPTGEREGRSYRLSSLKVIHSFCSKSRPWICMQLTIFIRIPSFFFLQRFYLYARHKYFWSICVMILSLCCQSMTTFNTFFASPQNSVRHTLSVRQRFLRLPRMINGIVSHKSWWTLSEEFLKKRTSLELKAFNLLPQSANGKQANQETQTEDLICSRCSRTVLRDWLHCIEVNHLGTQKIIHVLPFL